MLSGCCNLTLPCWGVCQGWAVSVSILPSHPPAPAPSQTPTSRCPGRRPLGHAGCAQEILCGIVVVQLVVTLRGEARKPPHRRAARVALVRGCQSSLRALRVPSVHSPCACSSKKDSHLISGQTDKNAANKKPGGEERQRDNPQRPQLAADVAMPTVTNELSTRVPPGGPAAQPCRGLSACPPPGPQLQG